MGVVIIRAEVLIIPLNGETKCAIHFTAGHFHILADVAVRNVAGVCPAESVVPLEHGLTVLIGRSDQRYHAGRMTVLQQSLHRSRGWKDILDEVLDGDFLHPGELLGVNRDLPLHLAENIIRGLNALGGVPVGEEDVVHRDVIEGGKSPPQRGQISQFGDGILGVLQHLLCVDGFRALVVCRSHDGFVFANRLVQLHPLADVDQERAHTVIADATDGHSGIHGLFPGKVVPKLFRGGGVHSLVLLELFQGVLPFLTLVEGLLGNQFQNGIDRVVRDLLQRAHEDVLGVTEWALEVADGAPAFIHELGGKLQIEMLPGMGCAIRELLVVLIRADLLKFGNIHIRNGVLFDVSVHSICHGLEGAPEAVEPPNGVDNGVFDEDHIANSPDKLPTAATVIRAPHPVNLICSRREAVQIQLPQRIFVHIHLVDVVGILAHFCEMLLDSLFELGEFHNFSPFRLFFFGIIASVAVQRGSKKCLSQPHSLLWGCFSVQGASVKEQRHLSHCSDGVY